MNEMEKQMIEVYKGAIEFYNMVNEDSDTFYADGYISGMENFRLDGYYYENR